MPTLVTTVRIPKDLKKKIQNDAGKERRSFNSQLVTIIDLHYKKKGK